MPMTFCLLGLAICAVWLRPYRTAGQTGIPLWLLPFTGAIVAGLAAGYLSGITLLWLALFGSAAYATACSEGRLRLAVFGAVTILLALALALHLLPGFNRLPLVRDFQFSADAIPYTQYASFDKAAVGLILLALLSRRSGTVAEWGTMLRSTLPIAAITIVTAIAAAAAAGYVRLDFKLSWYTPIFLVTNLLFVCIAEEAFFRGFLQERLARALTHVRFGEPAAIACSAVLFGAAHLGGGALYAGIATLAGLGYAYSYSVTRRIEAPILVHFGLNSVHFIGFTYPRLQ